MMFRSFGWAAALILAALLSSDGLAARVRSIDAELLAASDRLSNQDDQDITGLNRVLLEVPSGASSWAPAPGYGAPSPYSYYGYGAPPPYGYYGYGAPPPYGYSGYGTPSASESARRMVAEVPSYGPTPSPAGYGYNGYYGYGYYGYYGYGYSLILAPSGAAPSTRRMAMTSSSRHSAAAGHNIGGASRNGWGATSHLRRFMLDTPDAVPAPMDAPAPAYGAPPPYNGYYGYGAPPYGYSGYGAPPPPTYGMY